MLNRSTDLRFVHRRAQRPLIEVLVDLTVVSTEHAAELPIAETERVNEANCVRTDALQQLNDAVFDNTQLIGTQVSIL